MNPEHGADFRKPEYRREIFLRFYAWSLKYQSFPGGVHYVLPHVARELDLDEEQRAWLAFLNGNTQNPVTTLLLFGAAPRPEDSDKAVAFLNEHWGALQWDTDRRYHKAKFPRACAGYRALTGAGQARYWRKGDWDSCWERALAIPTMGRLSAWSYLEYLRILGLPVPDADTLMLQDISGSRSHRNGLCLVSGHEGWISDHQLGSYGGRYSPGMIRKLESEGARLLGDARDLVRTLGWDDRALGYLSLESALCTFKSWHKPNRRYPGVYNDMLYDRIRHGEIKFGRRFDLLWEARRTAFPPRLLLEDSPLDPGCVPVKQNWFLEHGEVINMTEEWPCFANGFESAVAQGSFGRREIRWI